MHYGIACTTVVFLQDAWKKIKLEVQKESISMNCDEDKHVFSLNSTCIS